MSYTAGAIASVAYDTTAPVLDGNVARVVMRLTAMEADPKSPATRARLWSAVEALLPDRRCGDFNQALMDLGATVCAPKSPNCPACPLDRWCAAREEGSVDRIPPVGRRTPVLPTAT